ncbi:N-acetylmuramoyl-L-alanine amidase [Parasporobacterium paucivorans]|uniref:N-acetylmuramoyl-L-alanine amidase n=1 Tax=Parasporobacterium paucivorans DSM 15970 TaxID=1122934 RepID=A0A1M6B0J3_9FIRM|nr:N-acetylmuramoyl-L-alanine amidase [Parasporobacterium paucivorans]SHI42211.1 N-acetylmuramoyl-L-alanine amidase [Parasporobacterium paucivorans DSM 15970]
MSKIICLDAGHGLKTAGKITLSGIHEWELNNKVCNYITEILTACGVTVVRVDDITGNTDVPLATRMAKIKALNPIASVSIHHNAGGGLGIESWVRNGARADSIAIAKLMTEKVSASTGLRNRGVKYGLLYMTTICNFPTILFEGGFMDSADMDYIVTEAGQRAYAKGVADTLIAYFGLVAETVNNEPVVATPVVAPAPTPAVVKPGIDVTYQVGNSRGAWLPNVVNDSDYAGIENRAIQGIMASLSKGSIRYRVHTIGGGWLPFVNDRTDFAGVWGRNIDGVQMALNNLPGYSVQYRVSLIGSTDYLPWVADLSDYAGIFGRQIDKLQIRIA